MQCEKWHNPSIGKSRKIMMLCSPSYLLYTELKIGEVRFVIDILCALQNQSSQNPSKKKTKRLTLSSAKTSLY